MNDIQKEIKKLSRLTQFKKMDKYSIEKIAQKNVWMRQINIEQRFSSIKDKNLASSIFENYLANYTFASFVDIENVADLVFEEITKLKIQQQLSELSADSTNKYLPDRLIESLHKVEDKIWILKEKAGIVGEKEKNDLTALEELNKKFKTYIAFNRNEFTLWAPIVCKKCGEKDVQPILLRRRVKNFSALKHPFFSGRFYYNRRGMELVKNGIWTKEQYAWVFQTSIKYIDWCLKNENKIVEIDDVETSEIKEFIDNKSYLKVEKNFINLEKNIKTKEE